MVMSDSSSEFTGKHRRCLRAIANRLKASDQMNTVILNVKNELSDSFVTNLDSVLVAHELVQVKTNAEKKKLAKVSTF